MQIVGAGFGRTGTLSLSQALEQIGFKPCYHVVEIFKHPGHIRIWQAAAEGKPVDWRAFLGGYAAGLDYPIAGFYKEILAHFPDARVILTVRDPEKWYQSTYETIYRGFALPGWFLRLAPPYRGLERMGRAAVWDRIFDGRFEEREYAIRKFEAHIEEVKAYVPAGRLLVFNPSEGWGPLCGFLGVPQPAGPFPHINDRKMTRRLYLIPRLVLPILLGGIGLGLAWLIYQILR